MMKGKTPEETTFDAEPIVTKLQLSTIPSQTLTGVVASHVFSFFLLFFFFFQQKKKLPLPLPLPLVPLLPLLGASKWKYDRHNRLSFYTRYSTHI